MNKGSDQKVFRLEEATIDELHAAIKDGRTTCVQVVQHYLARVRKYNGVASALVTLDGASVPPAKGAIRARTPIEFPTATVKAATLFPDLDKYEGPPLEFGRMEATASDPGVQQPAPEANATTGTSTTTTTTTAPATPPATSSTTTTTTEMDTTKKQ